MKKLFLLNVLLVISIMLAVIDVKGQQSSFELTNTGTNTADYKLTNDYGTWHVHGPRSTENHNLELIWTTPGGIWNRNFVMTYDGKIGLGGVNLPKGQLHFNNTSLNRKIVLWQLNDNDYQFYGFGLNASTLRYQVQSTADRHVFMQVLLLQEMLSCLEFRVMEI